MSRFASSWAAALGVVATALLASCDLGTITVPKTASTVVVHGVLNPNAANQVVLIERTLTGNVVVSDTGFDANDPIVSAGGVAVSGAVAEIIGPRGDTVRGVEDVTLQDSDGKGAGVYHFDLPGSALVLGGSYRLHIATTAGEELTASTRIPQPAVRAVGGLTRTLNRDHDVMLMQWNAAPGARTYFVRIESPFGPFLFFTDSTLFRATGDLRNFFASDLQRVFIPGFRQNAVVAAVDSNFYDYYRTNNDPFTGAGIISRVSGGIGLFGSLVELNTGTITVTADQTEPIEARFRLLTTNPGTSNAYASQLLLYIESKAAGDGLPDALSGRYTTPSPNSRSDGIIGQQLGSNITLALLGNQLAGDTLEVFDAVLRGDTLVGTYRKGGGSAVFVRPP